MSTPHLGFVLTSSVVNLALVAIVCAATSLGCHGASHGRNAEQTVLPDAGSVADGAIPPWCVGRAIRECRCTDGEIVRYDDTCPPVEAVCVAGEWKFPAEVYPCEGLVPLPDAGTAQNDAGIPEGDAGN